MHDDRPFWRSGSVVLALAGLVVVVVTDAVLRHTGGKPADFTLFVGRFHPLVVHLPIGFVLLVGAAEAATLSPRLRARLDPAVKLALPLLVLATTAAFLLGHLLARSGDFAPGALNVHRRFELFAAVGICLCPLAWEYQERADSDRARWLYRGLLGVALGVLSIGAHFGGTLTRGDTYLTRYAPGPLKELLGGTPAPAASASSAAKEPAREPRLYADVIQPILNERCVQCHGQEKVKGSLRLDSLASLEKGGEDGSVVTPGNPDDSPLLTRTLLPTSDDDHMPPEGKPGLTAPETATVRFWIERGANDTLLVRDLLAPEDARSLLEHALGSAPAAKLPTQTTPKSDSSAPSSAAPERAEPAPSASPAPGARPPSSAAPPAQKASSATAILAEHCVKCHGPDKQKGKLRVDSLAALEQGGKSGPAVVPGDLATSLLIERISLGAGDDKHMPPAKETQLTAHEFAALTGWVLGLGPSAARVVPAAQEKHAETGAHEAPARVAPAPPSPDLLAKLPPDLALYRTEVAPLLHSYCSGCHSGQAAAGGLAIDDYGALLKGGDTGPAITPGKPETSLLVHRIGLPVTDDDHMPPSDERQLTPDDIVLVTAWVAQGAGASEELALNGLPGPAVAAIAAHPPASTPNPAAPVNAPPRAASDVARATPAPRSAGCGACALGDRRGAPAGSALAGFALLAWFSARRRQAGLRRPSSHAQP
ncbi:MAG TPA: c-type cytochrome domain-containing protein [Polyangiaceae bacterium]|nr:c-type cytochrome domain-containing protein [Polyangiaceae bacterium]